MYCIEASIKNQSLEVPEIKTVNGTARVIACHFTFDDSWNDFPVRSAIFAHQLLGEVEMDIIGDECEVPKEILVKSGIISMAIRGESFDGKIQRTETQQIIKQKCTLQSGKNAIEPTPSQYAQFVEAVDEKIKGKQDKLIQGDGITIDENNRISATGGSSKPATKDTLGGVMVGDNLKITSEGVLSVDTANSVEKDNTKPITSAAVQVEVGNINEVLKII